MWNKLHINKNFLLGLVVTPLLFIKLLNLFKIEAANYVLSQCMLSANFKIHERDFRAETTSKVKIGRKDDMKTEETESSSLKVCMHQLKLQRNYVENSLT